MKLTKDILEQYGDAWLLKYAKEPPNYNPLDILKTEDPIEFEKKLTWLLMQPDYFAFLCKHIFNVELMPFQVVVLQELWKRKFPMLIGSRGMGKTFLLGLYCLLRALLLPGRKIVIAGAGFRQSKFVHEYMENIWRNAPVLRDLCDQNSGGVRAPDVCTFRVNESVINALPIGDGSKIRGYRANDLITDEFACLTKNTLIQTDKGLIRIQDYLSGEAYSLQNKDGNFEYPDTIFRTPKVDVWKISTRYGYEIECSQIHQVMTDKGWKKVVDLTNQDYIQLGKNDFFPKDFVSFDGYVLDKDTGWLLGLLVSEGSVTNRNNFSIINTDKKLIDKILQLSLNWKMDYRPAYKDKRGWDCKESWVLRCDNTELRTFFKRVGLDYEISVNKDVPKYILQSPKEVIISFLSGLYEGDGSAFISKTSDSEELQVVLYSSSTYLIKTVQILLLKFGIMSTINTRKGSLSDRQGYRLVTRGSQAVRLFDLLDVIKWDFNVNSLRVDVERKPSIRMNGDRFVVSTNLCNKTKYLGTFDSQEEAISAFNKFWEDTTEFVKVTKVENTGRQEVLYDFHMPQTHSFIGNGFIQHNSHSREIFETVLAGFGNVSANVVESVRLQESIAAAKKDGYDIEGYDISSPFQVSNQIVISGTAYYDFNHFAEYWKKWRKIILSKGDPKVLREIFDGKIEEGFDWRQYGVIRIPYNLLPKGFMDEGNIARSKASVHSGIFDMEYMCIFSSDSKGFYKRSLIEGCTANEKNNIVLPSGPIVFDAMLRGNPNKKYVIGVDPASEIDNFAIVVLEVNPDHRKIVHSWTMTRQAHIERVKLGLTTEDNFYTFCARKIRDLMKIFQTEKIVMDSQGGGIAVSEALHDSNALLNGEVPIWPIIEENKPKSSDDEVGLHIIELINFASSDWTNSANHSLRKDMEDKVLLFPKFDPVILGLSAEDDRVNNRLYDTLEDCVMEIEEMKNELTLIEITQTANGRDKWDTPEVKLGANKKKRMRKDRYSALLMANAGARTINLSPPPEYQSYGGFSKRFDQNKGNQAVEYIGPSWFTEGMRGVY
jgi:intein/homing endonuclease